MWSGAPGAARRCGTFDGLSQEPPSRGSGAKEHEMGDRGGKKDKQKSQKQSAKKQSDKAKVKEDRQPKRRP